jgi:predicted kinase
MHDPSPTGRTAPPFLNDGTQVVVLLVGSPGAGKSHFAAHLGPILRAVTLTGDKMKNAIYGSNEEIRRLDDWDGVNNTAYNAIAYSVRQVLAAGCSVVLDADHRSQNTRDLYREMAQEVGAAMLVAHILTRPALARQRALSRTAASIDVAFTEQQYDRVVTGRLSTLDAFANSDLVVEIDGSAAPAEQRGSFFAQWQTTFTRARDTQSQSQRPTRGPRSPDRPKRAERR